MPDNKMHFSVTLSDKGGGVLQGRGYAFDAVDEGFAGTAPRGLGARPHDSIGAGRLKPASVIHQHELHYIPNVTSTPRAIGPHSVFNPTIPGRCLRVPR